MRLKLGLGPALAIAGSSSAPPDSTEYKAHGTDLSMTMTFDTGEGGEKVVVFRRRPLGVDFSKAIPMTVRRTHHGGQAESFGIETGWRLTKHNGTVLDGQTSFDIRDMLLNTAMALPSWSRFSRGLAPLRISSPIKRLSACRTQG